MPKKPQMARTAARIHYGAAAIYWHICHGKKGFTPIEAMQETIKAINLSKMHAPDVDLDDLFKNFSAQAFDQDHRTACERIEQKYGYD